MTLNVNLNSVLTQALAALGYELIDLNTSNQGLLRVFIDFPWEPQQPVTRAISVDDCERVSRHLSFTLPVEGVEYQRLEVSSPGLDRPLRQPQDFVRFLGTEAIIKFRESIAGERRRKFQGILQASTKTDCFDLHLNDGSNQAITFAVAEIESARLVPQINFKKKNSSGSKKNES